MNLRNDLQGKYLSIWEYVNNSFDVFGAFVKKHPLIIFFHFLFSTALGLFISFVLWTPLRRMYEAALKYNKIQSKENTHDFVLTISAVIVCLAGYIVISGIIEFIIVIIRKKIGLEIENRIKEFKVSEIIVKFIIMIFKQAFHFLLLSPSTASFHPKTHCLLSDFYIFSSSAFCQIPAHLSDNLFSCTIGYLLSQCL